MPGLRIVHNGEVVLGATWDSVETGLATAVYGEAIDGFRSWVAEAAKSFSGVDLDLSGGSLDFLHECERAGLVIVIFGDPTTSYVPNEPAARRVYLERLEARRRGKDTD